MGRLSRLCLVVILTAVPSATFANDLLAKTCDGFFLDLSRHTVILGGTQREVTVERYVSLDAPFAMRIAPGGALSERQAVLHVLQSTDILCGRLEAEPGNVTVLEGSSDYWLLGASCGEPLASPRFTCE